MKKPILAALKGAWVVVILGVFAWYLVTNWAAFGAYAADVGIGWIAISVALLLCGKLILALTAIEALRGVPSALPYATSLWIYSLSQLGRYIPGSIWHYLGRIALYRSEGVPAKRGAAALLVESLWLLGTASAVGLAFSLPQLFALGPVPADTALVFAASGLVAVLWLAAMIWGTRMLGSRIGLGRMRPLRAGALQAVVWVALGLAFWSIFPPDMRNGETLIPAVGAFALAWAIGYVAPFAPAGLGVREAVILALLSGLLEPEGALAAAAMSRLLFTAVELGLGLVAGAAYKRRAEEGSNDEPSAT